MQAYMRDVVNWRAIGNNPKSKQLEVHSSMAAHSSVRRRCDGKDP